MTYTKIKSTTFEELQLNAGVLLTEFDPQTATVADSAILGETSGGVSFADTIEFMDMADGIDNAMLNSMELKRISSHEVKLSGTFVGVNEDAIAFLMAACDKSNGKLTPKNTLSTSDFHDIWWVGDYGNEGGFLALHLLNVLSTGGFQIQSADKGKGTYSFEFTAHYSLSAQDTVPYEVYVKSSTSE